MRRWLDREEVVLLDDFLVLDVRCELGEPVHLEEVLELFNEEDGVLVNRLADQMAFTCFETITDENIELILVVEGLVNVNDIHEHLE